MTNKNGLSASHFSSDISLNLNGMSQQWLDLLTDLDQGAAVQAPTVSVSAASPTPEQVATDPGSGPADLAWQEVRPVPPTPTPSQRRRLAIGVMAALSLSALLGSALQHFPVVPAPVAPPARTATIVKLPSVPQHITVRPAVALAAAPVAAAPAEPAPADRAADRPVERDEEADAPHGGLQQQLNDARDLLLHGQRDEAEQRYLQLLRTHHRSPAVRAHLGECALSAGKTDEAIGRFEEALQLRPGHAGGLYGMGMAYKASGNRERALYWFRRYQQQQPEGKRLPRVQRGIAALEDPLSEAEREAVERKLLAPF